jgi:hypothetical protein
VWVVAAEAEIAGHNVPLRNQIIAATAYGPEPARLAPQRPRDPAALPAAHASDPADAAKRAHRKGMGFIERLANAFTPAVLANDWAPAAGTSWIGLSQGLGGSAANAQGFVDGLAAAGWSIAFNWGDANAWESDWNSNSHIFADAVDFAFYTGHASPDGWVLNAPDDTFLSYTDVGSWPGDGNDRYGSGDLEWIVIAACGPHQSSHFVGSVGNAFDRWRGVFDGLHVFMGYGAITFDNSSEGSRVVELSRAGWPVIDAWFRTAWEIQPSDNGAAAPNGPTIFVTAMFAHNGDFATRNDHIWGTGTTVPDVTGAAQQRYLMWSGT